MCSSCSRNFMLIRLLTSLTAASDRICPTTAIFAMNIHLTFLHTLPLYNPSVVQAVSSNFPVFMKLHILLIFNLKMFGANFHLILNAGSAEVYIFCVHHCSDFCRAFVSPKKFSSCTLIVLGIFFATKSLRKGTFI